MARQSQFKLSDQQVSELEALRAEARDTDDVARALAPGEQGALFEGES